MMDARIIHTTPAPHGGVSLREGLICAAIGLGLGAVLALGLLWNEGMLSW